jgi:prepilin-type N-terminal cleavage/methylation domain-containing protein
VIPVRWSRAVCALVGVVLLSAGVLKALDPAEPLAAVAHTLQPMLGDGPSRPLLGLLVVGLVAVEAGLGLGLVLKPTRAVRTAASAVLLVFAIVLITRFTQADSPSCGCLGKWLSAKGTTQAWLDAVRNLTFAGSLVLLPALPIDRRPVRGTSSDRPRDAMTSRHSLAAPAHGFTVIELMVVLALITSLTALMIPALALVRQEARVIRSLSAQRQLAAALHTYAENNRDCFPFFRPLGTSWDPLLVSGWPSPRSFFGAYMTMWLALVAPDDEALLRMARYTPDTPRQIPPDDIPEQLFATYLTSYFLSPTLTADPRVFDTPLSDRPFLERPVHLRAVRQVEVLQPSRKGVILDLAVTARPSALPNVAAFADGSAARFDADHPPVPPIAVLGGRIPLIPVLSTRHGVRGVDR